MDRQWTTPASPSSARVAEFALDAYSTTHYSISEILEYIKTRQKKEGLSWIHRYRSLTEALDELEEWYKSRLLIGEN